MSRIYRSLLAAVAAALFAAGAFAQSPTKLKFTLDWVVQGQHAPFFVTLGKGYFAEEGLDVTIDVGAGSASAVQRVVTGAYDIGFADISTFIEFIGNNPGPLRLQAVYMIHERNPNTLFALKKSGITRPADMKGKKISGPVFSSTRKSWPLFARATGLKIDDVSWQNVGPDLVERVMVQGDVQMGSGYPANSQIYYALGVKPEELVMFKYADFGVDLYGNTMLATTRLINENPEALRKFLRALNRGMKDTIADPKGAIKYVMARNSLLKEDEELEKLNLIMEFYDTPNTRSDGLGAVRKARLDQQVDDVAVAFGLKTKPSPDLIFNSTFLPAKAERVYRK